MDTIAVLAGTSVLAVGGLTAFTQTADAAPTSVAVHAAHAAVVAVQARDDRHHHAEPGDDRGNHAEYGDDRGGDDGGGHHGSHNRSHGSDD